MSPKSPHWIALALLSCSALAVILGVVHIIQTSNSSPGHRVSVAEGLFGPENQRLALISLSGMIIEGEEEGSLFKAEAPSIRARRLLYDAAKDDSIKGVLLRINSPGGTVGMSQELYNAVLAVRRKKPIVVSMGDLAASGGYYTASAADKIVANPGTLTASIGVILQSMNLQGLVEGKLGVKAITIKSGKFKDILSPYRAVRPEEVALLQNIINRSYHQFLNAVLEGRTQGITDINAKKARIERITAIADGRVVVGEDALKIGLVDALGGQEDAKILLQNIVAKRSGLKHPERLKLEDYDGDDAGVFQMLGLSAHFNLTPKVQILGGIDPAATLGAKFPNQPLWVME